MIRSTSDLKVCTVSPIISYYLSRWIKPWSCNHPISLSSLLRRCGQMSNLESVNTSAPSAGNSFCSLATLDQLHMESTVQWKLAAKKTKKSLRVRSLQLVQISIPSPWHTDWGVGYIIIPPTGDALQCGEGFKWAPLKKRANQRRCGER